MTNQQQRTVNASGLVLGTMVMLVGTVFLLNELDIIYSRGIWQFWPMLVVGLGIARLMEPRKDGTREGGFLVFIGLWLLVNQTGLLRWRDSWPLLIVAVGISIVWKALTGRSGACEPACPPRPRRPARPGGAENPSSSEPGPVVTPHETLATVADESQPGSDGQAGAIARME